MCDGEEEPLCVQVCRPGALTYMKEEKEREKEPQLGEVEAGLETLISRYGLQQVVDYVAGKAKKY
jgi:benzoyl-CoA reductase subunit BamC